MIQCNSETHNRWAIILAGGEGKRLSALTQRIAGDARPKQFCPLIGNSTLVEQTRSRIARSIAHDRSLIVVTRAHERYYGPLLADMLQQNLVIQPESRGTATAITYALFRLSKLAPAACVALFPSDHFISDEHRFMHHVDQAFEVAQLQPELTVLLGIAPNNAETSYGWIEPGQSLDNEHPGVFKVRQFWEKPSAETAGGLLDRGCLWNSFVIVARASTLLSLIMIAAPELYRSFARLSSSFLTNTEERRIERLYGSIDDADFSREVLTRQPINLAVLPVQGCGWNDLGEPQRVLSLLSQRGASPRWRAA